ncbi:hypothetical protein NJ75_04670 [Novosphingobium subterraneum]|jgi:hypothetical protein|uniref:Uncharacterized protein n=1 Tax=Novosphingobium subterraneum TaxID=48936 RepID=A0A0B8Z5U2_9SPHN|nr:hypothetical protein NJ75_04670 [Novosphingobium subterraneum]
MSRHRILELGAGPADGEASGGTGQALRIAASHGVSVFKLQPPRTRAHVERHPVL